MLQNVGGVLAELYPTKLVDKVKRIKSNEQIYFYFTHLKPRLLLALLLSPLPRLPAL